MVKELLIIALDALMIPYFMAIEICNALVFQICEFDHLASCVLR